MGMIFKGLTFGGINSLDYGIFITGEAVYNAPERSVTSIEIEGRNGDLLIDNGRFLNIEVSYPAGCFAETQQDFKEKIELFRNAIVSQISYQRLTDDYNPDEYRLAVYKSGLDVSVAVLHQGGEFTLTFDCKPQRFLTSGETEKSIPDWSDIHTDSGSIVTIDNSSGEYAVKSLSTDIVPQQSGSGAPSPTNIRPITGFSSVSISRTGKNLLNTDDTVIGLLWNGNPDPSSARLIVPCESSTDYVLSMNGTNNLESIYIKPTDEVPALNRGTDISSLTSYSFTTGANDKYVVLELRKTYIKQADINNLKLQLEHGSTATAYEPFGTEYTVSFGSAGTVYGGTLDVISGVLTMDKFFKSFDGTETGWTKTGSLGENTKRYYMTWENMGVVGGVLNPAQALCSHLTYLSGNGGQFGTFNSTNNLFAVKDGNGAQFADDIDTFKAWLATQNTAGTPLQLCVGLATPQTYQLTPTQILLLLGNNYLWGNITDISVEYGNGGFYLNNPTLFDSKPLLIVTGYGTLGIGSQSITIENGYPSQVVYIDCESMEAWTETGGVKSPANDLIQNAGDAFPVLTSGMNAISLASTISEVKITPRWWRI